MPKKDVSIRMYRQGLGDCFLLTFPRTGKPLHMLIDCGALKSKHYGAELMKRIARDIKTATGGHLDVVALTHEHWDHISGFTDAREVFEAIDIDHVWVPWTEDPDSAAARRVKREFKKRKKAVEMALARMPELAPGPDADAESEDSNPLALYRAAIGHVFGFFGGLGAAGGKGATEEAWDWILGRGTQVYCDPNKPPLKLNGVPGVRVYVLGPPEDPEYIRKRLSSPETYHEADRGFSLADSFLAAVEGAGFGSEEGRRAMPFDEEWTIDPAQARAMPFFTAHYGFDGGADEWRRIDNDWLMVAGELALHLDSYTNNVCLALAIELIDSGRILLFPGDAQVGNWLSWGDLTWTVKDAEGATRKVDVDDLLARTVLYKVGHHGSHNATLRARGLEKMTSPDLVAMIPVHRKTADDQKWQFPYKPLWKRLKDRARCRVLLADADLDAIESDAKQRLSADEWDDFERRTTVAELYVEHRIPL